MTEQHGRDCMEQAPLPHVLKGVLNTERSTLLVSRVMQEPSSSLAPVHPARRSDGFEASTSFLLQEKGASFQILATFLSHHGLSASKLSGHRL